MIVEQGITGREIECAVLQGRDGAPPRTSGRRDRGRPRRRAASTTSRRSTSRARASPSSCPAKVPDDVSAEVRRLAAAIRALGCEGLARVDCFYTDRGDVIVNEINTMPGFTPHSMYPQMWAASGLECPELIDELITLALERPTGLR